MCCTEKDTELRLSCVLCMRIDFFYMLLCSVWLEVGIHLILDLLPNEYLSTWENGEQ